MREIIRITTVLLLLGFLQPAWADEIGHGGSGDPDAAPTDPVEIQADQDEGNWFDELLRWIFNEDEE